MKRISTSVLVIIFLCIVVAFSGCKKNNTASKQKPVDELKGNVLIYCFNQDAEALKDSSESFKKQHPQVNIQIIENDAKGIHNYIINDLTEENQPDIIQIKDENAKFYLDKFKNKFSPVTDTSAYDSSKYIKYRVKNLTYDGKVYGFPFSNNPYVLFYRRDLFIRQGIQIDDIKTWQDYIEEGKKLSQSSGSVVFPVDTDNYDIMFRLLLSQLDSSYFNKNGDVTIDTEKAYNAIALLKSFQDKDVLCKTKNKQDIIDKIKSGTISAIPAPSNFINELEQRIPELNGKWGVAKLPAFENGGNRDAFVDSSSFLLSSKCKDKQLVSEFMKYIASNKENSSKLASKYGVFCCSNSMYDDIIFESKDSYFSNEKVTNIFLNVLKGSNEPYYTKNYPLASDIVNSEIDNILVGKKDINMSLSELEKSIKEKIK